MKLSQLSTDQAAEVLCMMVPYIVDIASDEELLAEMKRKMDLPEGADRIDYIKIGAEKVNNLALILLKRKRQALYGIVGAVSGMDADQVAEQNILTTMKQIWDLVRDKDFRDFFRSCADMEGTE